MNKMHVTRIKTEDGREHVGIGPTRRLAIGAASQTLPASTKIADCSFKFSMREHGNAFE